MENLIIQNIKLIMEIEVRVFLTIGRIDNDLEPIFFGKMNDKIDNYLKECSIKMYNDYKDNYDLDFICPEWFRDYIDYDKINQLLI